MTLIGTLYASHATDKKAGQYAVIGLIYLVCERLQAEIIASSDIILHCSSSQDSCRVGQLSAGLCALKCNLLEPAQQDLVSANALTGYANIPSLLYTSIDRKCGRW